MRRPPRPPVDFADRYAWNPRIGKRGGYYDYAAHRIVSEREVRQAAEQFIDGAKQAMRAATEQLRDGQLTVAEWRIRMREEVRDAQRALGAVEAGGIRNLTPSDWGWIGQRTRTQYQYLDRFAEQIVSGKQKLNGQALTRAEMYADAARSTGQEQARRKGRAAGRRQARRVLGAAEHCATCLEEAAKGWRPVDAPPPVGLRPIGDSLCRTNCKCHFEFQ